MAVTNVVLLMQAAGHLINLILSLCVVIPMSVVESNFDGKCLLFTSGDFSGTGNFTPDWASTGYCGMTLFVGVLSTIVSVIQMMRVSCLIHRGHEISFPSAVLDAFVSILMTLLVLLCAIFVTRGLSTWCQALTKRYPSCEMAEDGMVIEGYSDIITTGFYFNMGVTQFGIWMMLVFWTAQLVLSSRRVFVYHERENIIVSMTRERRKYASQHQTYNSTEGSVASSPRSFLD